MVSISYTTRPRRPDEVEGVDYFYVDEDRFSQMVEDGEFLEYETVFGYHYGTPRRWVEDMLRQKKDVILVIDWQGARDIRALFPDCVTIFILPPDLATLEKRLRNRGMDDEATIRRRFSEAMEEISHYPGYDRLVVNDSLETALAELTDLVISKRKNLPYKGPDHQEFARQLMTEGGQIQ